MSEKKKEVFEEGKWQWKMEWCRKKGLPPADSTVWNRAEEAWEKKKLKLSDNGEEIK